MPQLKLSGNTSGELSTNATMIEYRRGSLFDNVPAEALLVQSCNCDGVWGKGIALEFKKRYPKAFELHRAYCRKSDTREMLGKAMMIPPCENDHNKHHYIACLFVKPKPGRPKDEPAKAELKEATALAMQQLLDGLVEQRRTGDAYIREIRMPKINSGIFDIDWKDTERMLARLKVPDNVIYDSLRKIVVCVGEEDLPDSAADPGVSNSPEAEVISDDDNDEIMGEKHEISDKDTIQVINN